MLKKGFKIFSFFILMFCLWNCNSIWYGIQQGRGQFKIVYGADPVSEFLGDATYPDSLKAKLRLIEDIKTFAIDSLGINPSGNYEKLFDQKGKPVMWVVTACDEFKLKTYYWKFPFLGKFSYKGYFDEERALKEEKKLKEEGYDTDIGIVNAWSTLGWFKDPIMSSMLKKSPGQLARVIIHELTHGTLYVKNNIQFNENLASFVGDKGAILFLNWKYGALSPEVKDYLDDFSDMAKVRSHLLRGTEELKLFYSSNDSVFVKDNKQKEIERVIVGLDTITLYNKGKLDNIINNSNSINNTFFTDFLTYRKDQNSLEEEFVKDFNSNFDDYLTYLKNKYPSL
jgi:predicted aminopeptidase